MCSFLDELILKTESWVQKNREDVWITCELFRSLRGKEISKREWDPHLLIYSLSLVIEWALFSLLIWKYCFHFYGTPTSVENYLGATVF